MNVPLPSEPKRPRALPVLRVLLVLVVSGCAAVQPIAVQVAQTAGRQLLEAAAANYGSGHSEDVDRLLVSLDWNIGAPPRPPQAVSPPPGYPEGAGSQRGYPDDSVVPRGEAPSPTLDIALMKSVGSTVVPIENGAELRDGRGDPMAGDQFRISFRPTTDSWVYVIAIDATGWVQSLFPSEFPDTINPARGDRTYLLPDDAHWYGLDQYRGVEHIYFLASANRRADIEGLLGKFAGQERPVTESPVLVEEAVVVAGEADGVVARGLTGISPGSKAVVQTQSGQGDVVTPTNVRLKVTGADLVVTRWFHHR